MIDNINDFNQLMELNCFGSKNDAVSYFILDYIARTKEPVGSWVLSAMLQYGGLEISVASVGRILIDLDIKGYTVAIKNKGRIITEEGINCLKEKNVQVEHELIQKRILKSTTPNDYYELLDLTIARRAVEMECAKLAAQNATLEQKNYIVKALEVHKVKTIAGNDPTKEAFDFHMTVAEATNNRFFIATVQLLVYFNKIIEAAFPELATRNSECLHLEHRKITEAIVNGDSKEASLQMYNHMTTIYETIKSELEKSTK